MIEAQYTQNVHKRLPSVIDAWKINDNYAGGVPDAFYRNLDTTVATRPLWIEYKFLKTLPKRPTTVIVPDLSGLQLKKLNEIEAANNDERGLVIVGVEKVDGFRAAAGFELYANEWATGITAEEARKRCKEYQGICDLIHKKTVNY